mmetsp:Transcript_15722/g.30500  ORF Transcript_15722/g.30500 Transcript_15722/m.30500 type:complete len:201 (-) Transcript_15722:356-958(-)
MLSSLVKRQLLKPQLTNVGHGLPSIPFNWKRNQDLDVAFPKTRGIGKAIIHPYNLVWSLKLTTIPSSAKDVVQACMHHVTAWKHQVEPCEIQEVPVAAMAFSRPKKNPGLELSSGPLLRPWVVSKDGLSCKSQPSPCRAGCPVRTVRISNECLLQSNLRHCCTFQKLAKVLLHLVDGIRLAAILEALMLWHQVAITKEAL